MAVARYRVAQVGLGQRGTVHADAFLKLQARFELVGLCELRRDRLEEYALANSLSPKILYADAETMLKETKPDIFCFITLPQPPRLAFVEMAARYGVNSIAFEKPIANSMGEAAGIMRLCRERGIRGVVSHQQKYLTSFQKLKEILDRGETGKTTLMTATTQAWLMQCGTHFVDMTLWANGFAKAKWVTGHVHGKEKLADSHPSPNYASGHVGFANGARASFEFGKLAPSWIPDRAFWFDSRLTVYGTTGYVWADTDGGWGAFTPQTGGRAIEERGAGWMEQEPVRLQPLYLGELADWLDGKIPDHSCNLERAYEGYELMQALCVSALDNARVDLPLSAGRYCDVFERMRRELPDCPELFPAAPLGS